MIKTLALFSLSLLVSPPNKKVSIALLGGRKGIFPFSFSDLLSSSASSSFLLLLFSFSFFSVLIISNLDMVYSTTFYLDFSPVQILNLRLLLRSRSVQWPVFVFFLFYEYRSQLLLASYSPPHQERNYEQVLKAIAVLVISFS